MQGFPDANDMDQAVVFSDIANYAKANDSYRKVVHTQYVQVVLYALELGETLPMEAHCESAQVLNIVEGKATVTIGERKTRVGAGDVVIVNPGTPHRVVPAGERLKLWSVYTHPGFTAGHEDKRQPEPRVGAPVAMLGAGFARGMTVNETVDGSGGVCIAHGGVPVCHHTHDSLDTIAKWIANDTGDVVCPTCAVELGATLPSALRLPGKKKKPRKKATEGWALLMPGPPAAKGGETKASIEVSVVKEDRAKHMFAGRSKTDKKYALYASNSLLIKGMQDNERLVKPRQGVHLLLEAGKTQIISVERVPAKFPFYITTNFGGGLGDVNSDSGAYEINGSRVRAVTKKTAGMSMNFTTYTPGVAKWWYQCTKYTFMGGPISIYPTGTSPVYSPKDGTLVLQDVLNGLFTVMREGRDDHLEGLSFEEMLTATLRQGHRQGQISVPKKEAADEVVKRPGGRSLLAIDRSEDLRERLVDPRGKKNPGNLVARADALPPTHKAAILPDLTIDRDELETTLHITRENMDDDCLVDGGCLPSTGTHTLLRFATRTPNIAPEGGDLVIGPPPAHANPGLGLVREKTITANGVAIQWEWHPCHQHWHLIGYVDAELLFASNMSSATTTAKHSFCLRDTGCTRPGASPKFTCENQGITAGCHDTYSVSTQCQWIVVDGLPEDEDYVLRLTVDPTNFIPESDEKNNDVEVYFRLEDIPSSASDIEFDAMLWIAAITLVCEIAALRNE